MANCGQCGKKLQGRRDKKFCDDHCRSTYNNRWLGQTNNYVRNINRILRKNRKILSELMNGSETVKVSEFKLVAAGFNFKYFTNTYVTKTGKTYFFCYDYGYIPIGKEMYTVVLKKEYVR